MRDIENFACSKVFQMVQNRNNGNDEKTKLLENFRSSGQTQAAFAEHNGINLKTFQKWLHNWIRLLSNIR